jgi:pimeloyl-ACP methyl ester carboxylesterase
METVSFEGRDRIRLAADAAGDADAPPVLLFHGGGQTRHAWGTTLAVLAGHGWRAYSVDLRGHGESGWDEAGDYTLDAFAADVRAIASTLPRPPALVGASLGGVASMAAIAETDGLPIASALVLVDVAPTIERAGAQRIGAFMAQHMEHGFGSLEEVADAIAAYNPHRPRPSDLSGLSKNLRRRPDGRWAWHWDPRFISGRLGSRDETRSSLVDAQRLRAAARALTIPVLLVRGRMSDLLSEAGARELLELVPHARLVDVAGAGHMVAGDRNDLFNDAIVSFLEDVRHDDSH